MDGFVVKGVKMLVIFLFIIDEVIVYLFLGFKFGDECYVFVFVLLIDILGFWIFCWEVM